MAVCLFSVLICYRQRKLQRVKTLAIHATTGRPSWYPEPPKVPLPSVFNFCSLFIILLALLLPCLFMWDNTRIPVMDVFVKNIVGSVAGPTLPPLTLPKLGQVCSSGEYSQQGLQKGSATLDSTWWSTALGDGAQIQLQSVNYDFWWGPTATPSPISGSIFQSPVAPPSPNSSFYPPPILTSPPPPSPPLASPTPSPPPVFGQIDSAANGVVLSFSNMNISVFQAQNSAGEDVTGTFFLGSFHTPDLFKVTSEDTASNLYSGYNFTSNEDFSSLSIPSADSGSSFYLLITNSSSFDGIFYAGVFYDGVFYNNSLLSFDVIRGMGQGRRRKLLQTGFRDTKNQGLGTDNSTPKPPPPPPPPNTDYSKYANWGTGPVGLYSTKPPSASEFITVKRLNTTSFFLMAPNGMYISPTSEGYLAAVTNERTAEAVFTAIIVDQKKIQLQAYNGKKVAWSTSGGKGALRLDDFSEGEDAATVATWNVREVMQVARMRGVNLGGWLLMEEWMSPSLYDKVPDLVDGWQIYLKSVKTGKYVKTWSNNNQVHCDKDGTPGDSETYHVRRDNGTSAAAKFKLRSRPTGNYLMASNGGGGNLWTSSADADTSGNDVFTLHVSPFQRSLVMLETRNGKFIRAKSDGSLDADGNSPGDLNERATWDSDVAFKMERASAVQSEWQVSRWSPSAATDLGEHRASFISESDWKYMASVGINTVRIPVGYWIAQKAIPDWPFVRGGLEALDAAFVFAESYNIRIFLSMHSAPGGQNRGAESSSRDGILDWGREGTTHVKDTLDAIGFLAERYGKSKSLMGIGTLNEPNVDLNQIMNNKALTVLKQFHLDAYDIIRQYSPCCFVGISGFVGGKDSDFDGHMVDPLKYNNVIYDVHYYQVFTPSFEGKNVNFHLNYVRDIYGKEIATLNKQGGRTVMIGEWSLGLPRSAKAKKRNYRSFGRAQLETYDTASGGWFFWSLKVSEGSTGYPNWSFKEGYKRGWLRY